jgi:hypothetical protein
MLCAYYDTADAAPNTLFVRRAMPFRGLRVAACSNAALPRRQSQRFRLSELSVESFSTLELGQLLRRRAPQLDEPTAQTVVTQ